MRAIARSIDAFGFNAPILVDKTSQIVAGHGRYEAARFLGLERIPVISLDHLTEAQARTYLLADNKLAERAGTVTNMGTISGQHGVVLAAGGSVSNSALASIVGQSSGIFFEGVAGTLVNAGNVSATASGSSGADIEAGGSVVNNLGGSISGSSFGIFLTGGSGAVTNAGSIGSVNNTGIELGPAASSPMQPAGPFPVQASASPFMEVRERSPMRGLFREGYPRFGSTALAATG